jgi:ABC-type branched-subunit amino acid transport system substrate-binding protein
MGGDRLYCSISFVGTESLKKALGRYGEKVIVSQVVPSPKDTEIPLIAEYVEAMTKYQHDVPNTFTSLEGYIAGKLFARIAASVHGELTRDNFIKAMEETGRFDLGGVELQFGKKDHQGMDTIYLTRIMPKIQLLDAQQ